MIYSEPQTAPRSGSRFDLNVLLTDYCRTRVEAEKGQNLDRGMTKTAKLANGQLMVLGIRAGKPQKTVSEQKSPLGGSP